VLFSIRGDEIRWSSRNARFVSIVGTARASISNTTIDKSIADDADLYSVSFSGTADYFGEPLTFNTTSAFRGGMGAYPELGILRLIGGASAADVLHGDRPDVRPTDGRVRVDATGNGDFGTMHSFDWSDVAHGVFFEIGDGEVYGLPPGGVDVTTRTSALGGTIEDAAVDPQRNRIYFSITDRNEVVIVDGDSLLVTDRIFVGPGPRGIWLSEDGSTLYSALSQAGAVSALDVETRALETIQVAQAIGSSAAYDVLEASPGVLFVTGNPGPGVGSYVARVDRALNDQITRVADGRSVGNGAHIFISPDRRKVYVGQGPIFFELDPADREAPVVVDGGAAGARVARTLSISPDGGTLYFDTGDVRDAASFEKFGELHRGIPYALLNGHEVALVDGAYFTGTHVFQFDILSAERLDRLDRFTIDCGLSGGANGLVPLRQGGQWLFYSESGICAADILNPDSPPGIDGEGIPPPEVERVSVNAIETTAFESRGVVYERGRQRLFTADDSVIVSAAADTLVPIDTYDVGDRVREFALSPFGDEVAIALESSSSLAFLEIDTGQIETVDFAEPLDLTVISDVAYLDAETLYLSAWGGPTSTQMLVKVSRSNAAPPTRVFPGASSVHGFSLVASADLQRLYASTSSGSPEGIFALDASNPSHPLVAQTDATVSGPWGLELSPDASLIALSSGELFSSSDLAGRGLIDPGASGFSGDSRQIASARSVGELHVFSTTTFTKTLIVETGCGQTAVGRVVAIPEQGAWVMEAGQTLCRFSMPAAPDAMNNQIPLKGALVASRYHCNDDCLARKYVAPILMRSNASKLDRSLRLVHAEERR
jgi:DNA-binding beta-propeller fold protein YncE